MTDPFGRCARHHWQLEPDLAYLNHGSFGAVLRVVRAAQDRWRDQAERDPMRFFVDELQPALDAARARLAPTVGAAPSDLAFVQNATEGANAVLRSLPLRRGQRLVTTDHVYPAVLAAARYFAARAGAEVVIAKVPFPIEGPDAVLQALDDVLRPGDAALLLDHITSATGLVFPVAEAAALAAARGVPVLVDGAHGPGQVPVDLAALGAAGVTWYTANAHKWLCAARGCALLWASPDRPNARTLQPPVVSFRAHEPFPAPFDWTGTRDVSAWLSLDAALDWADAIGPETIRTRNHEQLERGVALLCAAWRVAPSSPESMRGTLATLPWPAPIDPTPEAARALASVLRERHRVVAMPVPFGGRMWIRVSAHLYNDDEDFERLARALP